MYIYIYIYILLRGFISPTSKVNISLNIKYTNDLDNKKIENNCFKALSGSHEILVTV